MAEKISTITVKPADNEAYSLATVTSDPRQATAADLQAGLDNLVMEIPEGMSDLVVSTIEYLYRDYFVFAHQSGLYNRQIRLWEMFSRISTIEVKQQERGFFTRVSLPVYEIVMKTALGQIPVVALVIDKDIVGHQVFKHHGSAAGKIYVELLREFLIKVMKIQARLGANGVKGIFVVTREPMETPLLAYIEKETGATDAVSKVESIMPAPVSAHINLLTYGRGGHEEDSVMPGKPPISLAHPKIVRKTAAQS